MLKVLVHRPEWANRWIPYFTETLSKHYDVIEISTDVIEEIEEQSKEADVLISMWFNGVVSFWSKRFPEKKIIAYLRRYELFELARLEKYTDFSAIDAIIFCNGSLKNYFEISTFGKPKSTHLIYNAIDLNDFPLKTGDKTCKIGVVGISRHIKNAPLALMILDALPEEYTLHCADKNRDGRVISELVLLASHFGIAHRLFIYDFISEDSMFKFYQDKDIILSTSMNEGNPNCIIEAMACGCKPAIYDWPGAMEQFPPANIFRTVDEACRIITNDFLEPQQYREWVRKKYSLDNIEKIHNIIESAMQDEKSPSSELPEVGYTLSDEYTGPELWV